MMMKEKKQFKIALERTRRIFPWYDELLKANKIKKISDINRMPFITEAILNEHYYDKDIPKQLKNKGVDVFRTSGTSSGNRKKIIWTKDDDKYYLKTRQEIFAGYVDKHCKIACADLGTGHAEATAIQIFKSLGLKSFFIDHRLHVKDHIKVLNEKKPDVIFTMPMILDNIIGYSKKMNIPLNLSVKKIVVVGDVVTGSWKNNVCNFFHLNKHDLFDILGSIEIGSIAHEVPKLGLYKFDQGIIPEVVDSRKMYPNLKNKEKILVLTALNREGFPAIRFVTNDIVEGFVKRKEGNKDAYFFKRIKGRVGKELKHGEKISIYDIKEAVNKYLGNVRFEIYKTTTEFRIHVAVDEINGDIKEKIKNYIKSRNKDVADMIKSSLLEDMEVVPTDFEKFDSSKFKQTILG